MLELYFCRPLTLQLCMLYRGCGGGGGGGGGSGSGVKIQGLMNNCKAENLSVWSLLSRILFTYDYYIIP